MKKLLFLVVLALTFQPAHAATKPLTQLAALGGATINSGLFIDKSTIYTYGNIESQTSDAVISAYDAKGTLLSRTIIDGGGSDYIAAGASDGIGNIWFAGGDTPALATPTIDTRTATAVNPDSATVEPIAELRSDITAATIWKFVLATGELTRYSLNLNAPTLVTGISADSKGISVIGLTLMKKIPTSFLISASPTGQFGKALYIGSAGTALNAVQRQSDRTIDLFGSSAEPLGGTRLVGKRDGVLIKIKAGKISKVVRSTGVKAEREWLQVGASTLLVGTTRTGKTLQVALTKFAQFKPIWNYTYTSTGDAVAYLNSSGAYLAYSTSTGVILNTYTTKGVLGSSYQSGTTQRPLALAYSRELGLVLLTSAGDQAFLFTPTSG